MHQLVKLDEALKEKSLIMWLSCEEGEGRTVADNSDQRCGVHLEGAVRWRRGSESLPTCLNWQNSCVSHRSVVSATVRGVDDDFPVPSWKHHNLCVVEMRRARLAQKGRALWQETRCDQCGACVKKIGMRFHKAYECSTRMMTCRYAACGAKFPAEQHAQHLLDCAVVRRRKELLESHEQHAHLLACELCGELFTGRHLTAHMETQCAYRIVSCDEGCGEKLPYHRLQAHKNFCTAPHMLHRREMVIRARRRPKNQQRPWSSKM